MLLDDVGLSLSLLKIFVQHRATLLAQQCCTMLAFFEQALTVQQVKHRYFFLRHASGTYL